MERVSIIIPNHNNARYIGSCLDSVINQDYPNKEVIIVDDGSTDNSREIVRDIIKKNKDIEITLLCQSNLNAAIARNRGMEFASGRYVLFLDSDDILEKNAISCLIRASMKKTVNLVIGNYYQVDEKNRIIGENKLFEKSANLDVRNNYATLLDLTPVPSNKLYDLKIIKNNNLVWGNVRIGQDLDFYLKYLLLCNSVALIDDRIYRYRKNPSSVTRTYDYRIFDIVNVFSDVKQYYEERGEVNLYNRFLPVLALKHYHFQMGKQLYYKRLSIRNLIVHYFAVNEKNLNYSKCKKEYHYYRQLRFKFRIKCIFRFLFTSSIYRYIKLGR